MRLSREELLNRLGWKNRFDYRNRHSFPVNEALYQPIDESREALERALNELEGGYVAVLGTPGSGKSTLLTQTLRYFPQRVIRYYAYIPDAQGIAARGEAINFLNDIVRAIEDAGLRAAVSCPFSVLCLSWTTKILSTDYNDIKGQVLRLLLDGRHIARWQANSSSEFS